MGLPIGGGRKRRRSYANYRPPRRDTRPRSDPFRVAIYLAAIAAAVWAYLNIDTIKGAAQSQLSQLGQFGALEEAAPVLGPTLTPTPDAAQMLADAQAAQAAGSYSEAIDLYRAVQELDPNNVEPSFQAARLLIYLAALESGERRDSLLEDARKAADRAILADPERPEGYAIAGKVMNWQGNTEESLNQVRLAIQIDGEYAVAHSYLAETQIDLDRWDEALESIQLALSLDPSSADIRRDYGYVLESLGDYASAAVQYETALNLDPNNPYIHSALGRVYRVLGRYDEALDQFFFVAGQLPENALMQYELGRTYDTFVGDPTSALEHYNAATDLDAELTPAWMRTGVLYYRQPSYAQAIPAFERVVAQGGADVDTYILLGLSYAFEGQCSQAIANLTLALNQSAAGEETLEAIAPGYEACQQPTPIYTPSAIETPAADQ
ncbi:MAG: tetratricopeptide repeat protein [Anaerolineae bacterium]|nr:tetratricopeptide repeat protein [Anaerolineae bacterium]